MASAQSTSADLKQTAFHKFHRDHGAKMVEFAGWDMPLHYGSIIDEHRQVRASGGIFDVSHMGRFSFSGRDACRFLDRLCTRRVGTMKDGQARYSIVCNERGGCHDDVLVYRMGEGEYMMVCNAANRAKLLDHIASEKGDMVFKFEDFTERSAMVAVQGPAVMDLVGRYSTEIPQLKRYRFMRINVLGLEVFVSRTGYTGEDGVEVIFRTDGLIAKAALKMLLGDLGAVEDTLRPTGLGARDSLRLEAAMALYGHEITEDVDPLSAGLSFAIALDKGDDDPDATPFIGQEALKKLSADGLPYRLVGLFLDSKRAARHGMPVLSGDAAIGHVTSGCVSPTLERSIAMALLETGPSEGMEQVQVDLGRERVAAEIVPLPFYKPGK